MCASLSHTHYWYEVGMPKVPAIYAIRPVPSLSGHAVAYRWRSLPRVCWHRASSPKVVPVTGAASVAYSGPINVRLFSPTPTIAMKRAC